jgi:hypothetical protein
VSVILGDSLEVLPTLEAGSFDGVVTDPPYGLSFMGREWDHGVPGVEFWQAALRVLKPGGYMLCMGGTRTYHRLACAVEDAGFEIRDCLMWLHGQGFPKGQGCLKPAWEPILLCRKPGPGVLPLGIEECRVQCGERPRISADRGRFTGNAFKGGEDGSLCGSRADGTTTNGRYPANVLHDGGDEVMEAFGAFGEKTTNAKTRAGYKQSNAVYGPLAHDSGRTYESDSGTAARFFFCAKASRSERGEGNGHPTVKPLALIRWLVRLACPSPGGTVLDPFLGSGTTALACLQEGRRCVGVEKEPAYVETARKRLAAERAKLPLFATEEVVA